MQEERYLQYKKLPTYLELPRGTAPYIRKGKKVGRNDKCPCESGKKFKKCCG